jgi:hypothetical protein
MPARMSATLQRVAAAASTAGEAHLQTHPSVRGPAHSALLAFVGWGQDGSGLPLRPLSYLHNEQALWRQTCRTVEPEL